jgi:hypothetical protein
MIYVDWIHIYGSLVLAQVFSGNLKKPYKTLEKEENNYPMFLVLMAANTAVIVPAVELVHL